MTGRLLPGPRTAIEPRQVELDALVERMLPAGAESSNGTSGAGVSITVSRSAEPPTMKLAGLIENSPTFSSTWRRTRHKPDWSQSEWDFSLASKAATAGWSDQEICDLLVAHRRQAGEGPKRVAYYRRTIAKARVERPGAVSTASKSDQPLNDPVSGETGDETIDDRVEKGGSKVGHDWETGDPVYALDALNKLSAPVVFRAEWRQIGGSGRSTFFGTILNQRTNEPQEIGPFTRTQLRQMSYLADEIWDADGGDLDVYRRNTPDWKAFYKALKDATRFEEHHVTEASIWRPRVVNYLADRVTGNVDPETAKGRTQILAKLKGDPFSDPAGRVYVSAENLSEALRPLRLDLTVAQVAAALRVNLDFEAKDVQQRLGSEKINKHLNYWRAPADFDWNAEL